MMMIKKKMEIMKVKINGGEDKNYVYDENYNGNNDEPL
jgi:hypothetical protein